MTMTVPAPPQGLKRIAWLGPGFLWMVSAAGSGELLFTPRVGALYGYALLWAMVAAVALKWFINREIGRFAVCTGKSIIEGFAALPGPRHWALWPILVPQLFVAVTAIAGLAGSAATALALVLPGDIRLWMGASLLLSTTLVFWGRYRAVEIAATVIGVALAVTAVIAAASAKPHGADFAAGFVPRIPPNLRYDEILPWLGFMLSGAAGMMWYSYWVVAKGYGAAGGRTARGDAGGDGGGGRTHGDGGGPDPRRLPAAAQERLRGWLTQMTFDNSVAVVGTFVITCAFLVLGAELLRPKGLVPEENRVAEVLGQLLGALWGPVGFWFMVVCVFVGFWDTVLSDQDGHSRLFANGTRLVLRSIGVSAKGAGEARLRRVFLAVLLTLLPLALYLAVGQPVALLKIAGAIEAAHIPIVAGMTLYLNHHNLPAGLRASAFSFAATAVAALFFLAFAILYIVQVAG
jgi:Mn2+/Fe2+ NRAMP family transporter